MEHGNYSLTDLPVLSLFNFPASVQMDPATFHIIEWLNDSLTEMDMKYKKLKAELRHQREQNARLESQYERLEEYNHQVESRLNALRDVLGSFIDHSTRDVRRDLLDEFNAVARDYNIDLEEMEIIYPDDEFETESVASSLDAMFE